MWIGVALFLLLLGASALFMTVVKQEFVPFEDRGGFFISVVGPEGASFQAMLDVMDEVEAPLVTRLGGEIERLLVRVPGFGSGDEVNSGFVIATLSDWDSGRRGTDVIAEEVGREVANLLDARAFVIPRQGFGLRLTQAVQITIGGGTFDELAQWRDRVLARAADELPGLVRLDSDYRATKPQIELDIDLDKAADLGVTNLQIAQTLETFMSGRRVTTYEDDGEEYNVLIQAPDDARRSPDVLDEIYVRSSQNELVPLTMLVSTREVAAAATLNRLDRVRTITLSAGLAPGYTLGEALEDLETLIREELPEQVQVNYSGESRDFKDSAQSIFLVFGMALLVVYLVLAAQFELRASAGGDVHRAAGDLRRAAGAADLRPVIQHLFANRHGDADRHGGEKRHPDCRVCQPTTRRRHGFRRGIDHGIGDSAAAHPDDHAVDCRRRRAADSVQRSRVRGADDSRPGGFWRGRPVSRHHAGGCALLLRALVSQNRLTQPARACAGRPV